MGHQLVDYNEVRGRMNPGDIVAFSGKGHFSEIIKWATRAPVSHVGIMFESRILINNEAQPGKVVDILEATTLHEDPVTGTKIAGVQKNRLSDKFILST